MPFWIHSTALQHLDLSVYHNRSTGLSCSIDQEGVLTVFPRSILVLHASTNSRKSYDPMSIRWKNIICDPIPLENRLELWLIYFIKALHKHGRCGVIV